MHCRRTVERTPPPDRLRRLAIRLRAGSSRGRRCIGTRRLGGGGGIAAGIGRVPGCDRRRPIPGSIRAVDSAYRYGGDEFLVLLPETDYAGAFVVAEKIRGEAEEMGYRLEAEGAATSVSIGLVSHPEDGGTADELVRAADRAMYNAKSLGKNQISGYPRPPRLAGPVAVAVPDDHEKPEPGSSGATISVPIGEPMEAPSPAAAAVAADPEVES